MYGATIANLTVGNGSSPTGPLTYDTLFNQVWRSGEMQLESKRRN